MVEIAVSTGAEVDGWRYGFFPLAADDLSVDVSASIWSSMSSRANAKSLKTSGDSVDSLARRLENFWDLNFFVATQRGGDHRLTEHTAGGGIRLSFYSVVECCWKVGACG